MLRYQQPGNMCLNPCHCTDEIIREISPPRERKPANGQQDRFVNMALLAQTLFPSCSTLCYCRHPRRKFSWATQRIHDLQKDLEGTQSKLKVNDRPKHRQNCQGTSASGLSKE